MRQILACLIVLDHGCGVDWTCHPWTEVGTSVKHLGVVVGAGILHLGARAYHILRYFLLRFELIFSGLKELCYDLVDALGEVLHCIQAQLLLVRLNKMERRFGFVLILFTYTSIIFLR